MNNDALREQIAKAIMFPEPEDIDAIMQLIQAHDTAQQTALLYSLPGEAEAADVASNEDERYGYFTAKNAFNQAIDQCRAAVKRVYGGGV